MWKLKKNYPREEEDTKCPIWQSKGRQNRTCT